MEYSKWKNENIADLPGEIWKPVPNFNGTFASNFGRIKTEARTVSVCGGGTRYVEATIKKQVLGKDGYLRTDAVKNGKLKKVTAHRLCALAFKPNPENKKTVQHNNHIKHCNEEWNLSWFTHSEQGIDAYNNGRKAPMGMLGKSGSKHHLSKPVICVSNGETYGSIREAAAIIKLSAPTISELANLSIPKLTKGIVWHFKYA